VANPRFDRSPPERDPTRINERIRVSEVMLIDEEGNQVGIVPTEQAMERAAEKDLDLVEVAADARPPVATNGTGDASATATDSGRDAAGGDASGHAAGGRSGLWVRDRGHGKGARGPPVSCLRLSVRASLLESSSRAPAGPAHRKNRCVRFEKLTRPPAVGRDAQVAF